MKKICFIERFYSLGASIAKMDKKLMEFKGDVLSSELAWDARKFFDLKGHLEYVKNPKMKKTIAEIFLEYGRLQPKLDKLRLSLTHNDANDTNTIMKENGKKVLAFIDLGDVLTCYTINDLAVAAVYYLFKQKDVLSALDHIVRGYNMILNVLPEEIEVFPFLMKLRLAQSLLMSSYSSSKNPDNEYLVSSQKDAWGLLSFLVEDVHPNYLIYLLRRACHCQFPCPEEEKLLKFCVSQKFAPLFDYDFTNPNILQVLDLSNTSGFQKKMPKAVDQQTEYIFSYLESMSKKIGLGRYNEERSIYTSENFIPKEKEARTIHLGNDLFVQANTPIHCPLDGVVYGFEDAKIELDYGPVIILQHEIKEYDLVFYTLYGHLSEDSLNGLSIGKKIHKGEIFCHVGNFPTNGNWPPHVHFQIINDILGNTSNFIGVSTKSQRQLWLSVCPNPNLILQIPDAAFSTSKLTPEEIMAQRNQSICKALSISYESPLLIQKGSMQHLIDDRNNMYLDCVNNVAHIGHSHPKLLSEISEQFAILNTNTRYLSEEMSRYTKELLSSFPKELNVVFLTNSGSEANDLALRLARNYTKRKDIIVVDHAYHGNLTSLIEISPYKFQGTGGFPCPEYIHIAEIPDGYRGAIKSSDPEIAKKYAKSVENIINSHPKKCAAFIAESILGCGGQVILPPGYLREVYESVRKDGGVCIADEVQVGFGRVGSHMWAFETQEVIPDIVTLGKPIGNGYPLGAVVTKMEIAEKFANGMEYFNTFGGSNASCAVGYNVLKILKEEKLKENAEFLGKVMLDGLNELKNKYEIIGDVRGLGMFVGVELVKDRKTLAPADKELTWIVEYMKNNEKILLSTDGPLHNVLKIKPPLCWRVEDCGDLIAGLDRAFQKLLANN